MVNRTLRFVASRPGPILYVPHGVPGDKVVAVMRKGDGLADGADNWRNTQRLDVFGYSLGSFQFEVILHTGGIQCQLDFVAPVSRKPVAQLDQPRCIMMQYFVLLHGHQHPGQAVVYIFALFFA